MPRKGHCVAPGAGYKPKMSAVLGRRQRPDAAAACDAQPHGHAVAVIRLIWAPHNVVLERDDAPTARTHDLQLMVVRTAEDNVIAEDCDERQYSCGRVARRGFEPLTFLERAEVEFFERAT